MAELEKNIETVETSETVEPKEEVKVFKPITSQEELNAVVGKRIARAEDKVREQYADYDSLKDSVNNLQKELEDYRQKIADTESNSETIAELETKIKQYEVDSVKNKVAYELGIPSELVDRINGDTEEEIREDAMKIAHFTNRASSPSRNPESPVEEDGVTSAFKKLNPRLF